ncbi:hypothetical protein B0T26DRAFT_725630 [Lasiosphaeria miniovina]|uniref:Uncharacterized protein n=1 Tax=Lasiosphaeria miniovina TaxID=1954250 RepID=A0AA40DJR4_9PEZI|nr:uncharacterized protein B0T26DRAFT_725630 [Lasiosphaeria miniovina]KAK0706159.1 hypothetical protein B0T26DRAFT_725630 [Lasiosphaeria miniovina]
MASSTFSLEVAERCLDEDGFFRLDNPSIGEHISDLEQKGFPWVSKYGLDFCRKYVLDDRNIKAVVESILGECTLVHLLRYEAYPDHIVSWAGGSNVGRHSLLVHLHPKGAQVEYYKGSHIHDLPRKRGARFLWETEPSALSEVNCIAKAEPFPDGGM